MAKFYIYRCKVKQISLSLNVFISEIYQRYRVEHEINKNSVDFRNSWGPYMYLFKSLQTAPRN